MLQKEYKLNNGLSIPAIGFGTFKAASGEEAYNSTKNAILAGYTHIDTATIYGNEEDVGKAIKENAERKNIFLTTKLWNTERGETATLNAFNESLKKLQTDYVDLYLIHWPIPVDFKDSYKEKNAESWKLMEKLYKDGKIKAIGVSNFTAAHLEEFLSRVDVVPAVNQIEFHPGHYQKETLEYCKKHNILVEAWGPLGQGNVLSHPVLTEIAAKYNKSTAQVCVNWCLAKNTLPLPKSVNMERIKSNLDVYDFTLSAEDIEKIDNMEQTGYSGLNPDNIDF